FVDANYRTLPRREDTALLGSSLGGLASAYIGRRNPAVFSKVGCMSSSFWWNQQALTRQVEVETGKVPVRFYLDAGTSSDGLAETQRTRDALGADGSGQGSDLHYSVAAGPGHNDPAWAARLFIPPESLSPWQSREY